MKKRLMYIYAQLEPRPHPLLGNHKGAVEPRPHPVPGCGMSGLMCVNSHRCTQLLLTYRHHSSRGRRTRMREPLVVPSSVSQTIPPTSTPSPARCLCRRTRDTPQEPHAFLIEGLGVPTWTRGSEAPPLVTASCDAAPLGSCTGGKTASSAGPTQHFPPSPPRRRPLLKGGLWGREIEKRRLGESFCHAPKMRVQGASASRRKHGNRRPGSPDTCIGETTQNCPPERLMGVNED